MNEFISNHPILFIIIMFAVWMLVWSAIHGVSTAINNRADEKKDIDNDMLEQLRTIAAHLEQIESYLSETAPSVAAKELDEANRPGHW